MSLTSLLKERGSPLRATFRDLLPDAPRFVTALNRELGSHPLNTPRPPDPALSGTALDYRLRYMLVTMRSQETVASAGALRMLLALKRPPVEAALVRYFKDLDGIVGGFDPVGQLLSDEHERLLAAHCVVLAYCEQFFRSGRSRLFDVASSSGTLPTDLLTLAPAETVADVMSVSRSFFDRQYSALSGRLVLANPTFDGSRDVSGADADIVAGDSLVDFKSTIQDRPIEGDDLYQLLGYVCLDYSDKYRIRRAGFSLLRRDVLLEWDLASLVLKLSGGRTTLSLLKERIRSAIDGAGLAPTRD